jgi:hypothetical protein
MFSVKEKQFIAEQVEKLLLGLKHPEMPKERPVFKLRVEGAESWSWAEIAPNWMFNDANKPGVNPWNEVAREVIETTPRGKE